MSLFTKIVTGIFGKKAEKDLKLLAPAVGEINTAFEPLKSLSDDELKQRFQDCFLKFFFFKSLCFKGLT